MFLISGGYGSGGCGLGMEQVHHYPGAAGVSWPGGKQQGGGPGGDLGGQVTSGYPGPDHTSGYHLVTHIDPASSHPYTARYAYHLSAFL